MGDIATESRSVASGVTTRQRLIDVAGSLFYAKGIRAVGVDEVIAEAAVAKATLYRHFPSKEHLVSAYLEQRSEFALARLRDSALGSTDPRQQIVDAFRALDVNLHNPSFRGCAFLLAVSEHGELASVRRIAERHKASVRDHFVALAAGAGFADTALGDQLTLIYEGALATVVVRPDAEPGRVALDLVTALLSATLHGEAAR